MRSDPTLKRWYNRINAKFFYGQLPNNVCVRWVDDTEIGPGEILCNSDYAITDTGVDGRHCYEIMLSHRHNTGLTTTLNTLIHEMVHVATGLRDDHGPVFEQWRATLAERGIFKKGAVRKGLTLF